MLFRSVTEFRKWDNPYSAREEVEMIRKAIDKTGRDIVLSLSPGPAELSVADHLCEYANMWRLTGDFWDWWDKLYEMFDKCEKWAPYVKEGCWPDCDMLPLGNLSRNGTCHGPQDRYTQFTKDEQITLMTLWSIFRSPLMFGGEMRNNDEWTLSLMTNEEVLDVNQNSHGGKQVYRDENTIIWTAISSDNKPLIAVFNVSPENAEITVDLSKLDLAGEYILRDLWAKEDVEKVSGKFICTVNTHGAKLFKLK